MRDIRTCGIFEGIGGFPRAAQLIGKFDWRISVERDQDAIAVLESNFNHRVFGADIRDFHPDPGEYDLICGGFPCTGTSGAGNREGLNHPESALFREFLRCICQSQPKIILLEQPMGFINRGIRAWLGGVALAGYTSLDPIILGCDQLGAQFQRDRIFIISYLTEWAGQRVPRRWASGMREMVESQRDSGNWLTVEQRGDRISPRFPSQLVPEYQPSISCPTRHPGRLTARKLGGQTVTIPQAKIALECVKRVWAELQAESLP